MSFRTYDIIKHERFMDVAAEIVAIQPKLHGFAFTVKWLNLGFTKSWYLPVKQQSIYIRHSDFKHWQVALTSPACLRNAEWGPL